jgi:hypothetical protein
LSSTWPANHHRAKPAGDCAGQPLNRVFERHKTELRVYDALAVGRKTVAELHADLGLQPPCCRVVCGPAYPMKSEPTA